VTIRGRAQRLLKDWEKEIARPILVTSLTALLLFLCSLAFRPVRGFLFPVDEGYPIWCAVEAYATETDDELSIDVWVINRSDDDQTGDELQERLGDRLSGAAASPDLLLEFRRTQQGRIVRASEDGAFNRGKGRLAVDFADRAMTVRIEEIGGWAILKATASVADYPGLPGLDIPRGATVRVPFDVSTYHTACYSR